MLCQTQLCPLLIMPCMVLRSSKNLRLNYWIVSHQSHLLNNIHWYLWFFQWRWDITMKIENVSCLLAKFNVDIFFELPPICHWSWNQFNEMNATWAWFEKFLDYVWSCQVRSKLDNHGLPHLQPCLLKSNDNCNLWHAIKGHKSLMQIVEEIGCGCFIERSYKSRFQGVYGR